MYEFNGMKFSLSPCLEHCERHSRAGFFGASYHFFTPCHGNIGADSFYFWLAKIWHPSLQKKPRDLIGFFIAKCFHLYKIFLKDIMVANFMSKPLMLAPLFPEVISMLFRKLQKCYKMTKSTVMCKISNGPLREAGIIQWYVHILLLVPAIYSFCLLSHPLMTLKDFSVKSMYTTLPECMTLPDILPTTIFSVKLMHLCIESGSGNYSLKWCFN